MTILSFLHFSCAALFSTPPGFSDSTFLSPTPDQELLLIKSLNHSLDCEALCVVLSYHNWKPPEMEPSDLQNSTQTDLLVNEKDCNPFLEIYFLTTALKFLHNREKQKKQNSPQENTPTQNDRLEESSHYTFLVQKYSDALLTAYGHPQQEVFFNQIFKKNPQTNFWALSETFNAGLYALQHLIRAAELQSPTARLILIELYCDIAQEYFPFFKPGVTFSEALSEAMMRELNFQVQHKQADHARLVRANFLATPRHLNTSVSSAMLHIKDFIDLRLSTDNAADAFCIDRATTEEMSIPIGKFSGEELSRLIPILLKCAFHALHPNPPHNGPTHGPIDKKLIFLAATFFKRGFSLLTWKPGFFPLSYVYLRGIGVPANLQQALEILHVARAVKPYLFTPQAIECLYKVAMDPMTPLPEENVKFLESQALKNLVTTIGLTRSRLAAFFYLIATCQHYEKGPTPKTGLTLHGRRRNFAAIQINPSDVQNIDPNNPSFLEECLLLAEKEIETTSVLTSYHEEKNDWIRFFLSRCYCNGMLGFRNPQKAYSLLSAVDDHKVKSEDRHLKAFAKWLCSHKTHETALKANLKLGFCYCAYLGDSQEKNTKMLLGHPSFRTKNRIPTVSQTVCQNCLKKEQGQLPQKAPSSWEDDVMLEILDCALGRR